MGNDAAKPLGVAKIVTLGQDKVLIVEVNSDAAEGEYVIDSIKANPVGPAGAGDCGVQFN